MNTTNVPALVPPETSRIATIFSAEDARADFLREITEAAKAIPLDLSNKSRRDAFNSECYRIVKVRTAMDEWRKKATEDARKHIEAINGVWKIIEPALKQIHADARAPLTAFEESEAKRIEGHESRLKAITGITPAADSATLLNQIAEVEAIDCSKEAFEEFAEEAGKLRAVKLDALRQKLKSAIDLEAERAELEKLRREAAERAAAERKEREEREAEERRRDEAHRELQRQLADMQRQLREAEEAAERQKAERIAAEKAAAEAAENERKRLEAEALKAEQDRLAAEKAKADAERAEAERIAQAQRDEEARAALAAKRVAAREQAVADIAEFLRSGGVSAKIADRVAVSISQGLCPHTTFRPMVQE